MAKGSKASSPISSFLRIRCPAFGGDTSHSAGAPTFTYRYQVKSDLLQIFCIEADIERGAPLILALINESGCRDPSGGCCGEAWTLFLGMFGSIVR